jgi:hypothetical protein
MDSIGMTQAIGSLKGDGEATISGTGLKGFCHRTSIQSSAGSLEAKKYLSECAISWNVF